MKSMALFSNCAEKFMFKRKLHSMFHHWIASITTFGAPYLYSAEANEEFHKLACKVQQQYLRCRFGTSLIPV